LLGSFLFRGEDVFKKARVLSGGELSRLGLACTLAKKANFLLLDEPTNHLDMTSVETLSGGIADYEGTLLFVSHDRTFIDSVCTHVFAMLPDGRSMLFPGQLEDYRRMALVARFPNVMEIEEAPRTQLANAGDRKIGASQRHQDGKELKKKQQQLTTKKSQLEKAMQKTKEKCLEIEAKLASLPPKDYSEAIDLNRELEAQHFEMAQDEEKWLQIAEELEDVESILKNQGRT
jgi:ATP-binding cassette subfamily F protein 3